MTLRFQRRLSLGPLHLNLSKSGVGCSVGLRGMRWGVMPGGTHYRSLGLPGTGISWRSYDHGDHTSHGPHVHWLLWLAILAAWIVVRQVKP